jgi:hypothetical protein
VPGLLGLLGATVRVLEDHLGLSLRVVAARRDLFGQQVCPFRDPVLVHWLGHAPKATGDTRRKLTSEVSRSPAPHQMAGGTQP